MSPDDAPRTADDGLRTFIASMQAAGNPGSGKHEIGLHKVEGWILDYDSTVGGAEVQAVIGTDGAIHARREPRAVRTRKLTAAEWVRRNSPDVDSVVAAGEFADRLSHIRDFNGVGPDDSRG